MTKKSTSKGFSLDELRAMAKTGADRTRADVPEAAAEDSAFWVKAVRIDPKDRKTSIHLRVDAEVLEWFRAQGDGHLTRMNAVLRTYYEAKRTEPVRRSPRPGATVKSRRTVAQK